MAYQVPKLHHTWDYIHVDPSKEIAVEEGLCSDAFVLYVS